MMDEPLSHFDDLDAYGEALVSDIARTGLDPRPYIEKLGICPDCLETVVTQISDSIGPGPDRSYVLLYGFVYGLTVGRATQAKLSMN